jgi:hypothetical protein
MRNNKQVSPRTSTLAPKALDLPTSALLACTIIQPAYMKDHAAAFADPSSPRSSRAGKLKFLAFSNHLVCLDEEALEQRTTSWWRGT